MGVYSTKMVTRERAISSLLSYIHRATNKELEDMLFAAFGEKTFNTIVVEDDDPEDYPGP